MEAVVIVMVLAMIQYMFFGTMVGVVRGKTGVKAPAMSGDPMFERAMRVQMNTLEQLVVFLPAIWLFGTYVNPLWAAGFGVFYLIGRLIYRSAYMKDPDGRALGFVMSYLPTVIMLVWMLVVAIMAYA